MKKTVICIFCAAACALLLPLAGFAQTRVRGSVYCDANGNGRFDRSERGIGGVAVSNGHDIVLTDEKGRYELPVEADDVIFVVKPSGYRVPVDAQNLPRFYRIHKPAGSPEGLKYPGVAPTGKLPASVDFALLPAEESDDFSFFAFGDPQVQNAQEIDYFARGTVADAMQYRDKMAFGISLGDQVYDDLSLYGPYNDAVARLGLPWYNVVGNHDRNYEPGDDLYANETFQATYGPTSHAFRYGKAHFLVLDNVFIPAPETGIYYTSGLREDQFRFVGNYLKLVAPDELLVVCMHVPLLWFEWQKGDAPACRERLLGLLREVPNLLLLSGHTHRQYVLRYGEQEGWHGERPLHEFNVGTTCGDWYRGELDGNDLPEAVMRDGTPLGYAMVNVHGNTFTYDYKSVGHPLDYQLRIFAPEVVPALKHPGVYAYVNFFIGNPECRVEYRIDGGAWSAMTHSEEPDPYVIRQAQRWDTCSELLRGRRMSYAADTPHLWRARLDTTLGEGTHTLEVRATDLFGRCHSATAEYRIEKPRS